MYITEDGKRLFARDDDHLVAELRKESFSTSSSFASFMTDVAERAKLQCGAIIRTDDTANFVADLLAAGFITERPLN